MGILRGRELQEVRQGLALSFLNAPFGVFVWTLPLGIQDRDETRRTRKSVMGCRSSLVVQII